ncbi:Extracellular sulfatase SULF-1 like, partial [Pseudolycoriella hygida]
IQLQHHLAEIDKISSPNKRNCACFTPNGIVYKKIKTEKQFGSSLVQRNNENLIVGRHKRSIVGEKDFEHFYIVYGENMADLLKLSEVVDRLENEMRSGKRHSRRKRESLDHIGNVIMEIQDSLEQLEDSFKDNIKIESRGEDRKFGAKCFIENTGKVNCSNIIYEDEKSWKMSRIQIDLLIKVLKNKITDLKDIKKHLKEHKPVHMKDYDEIPSVEDDEYTRDTRPTFRKHSHQSHFNQHGRTDNRKLENRTTENELEQINITSPRLHNSHQRSRGNRSHWNVFRPHHGKKVNLEDLFADNKSKDKVTTVAPDGIDIENSSSSTKPNTEYETTRNYFYDFESTTKIVEDMHT